MKDLTKAQIKEIAEQLDLGFRAFYHKQTGELIFVPDFLQYPDMDSEVFDEDLEKLDNNFMDYHEFEAMQSHEKFEMMKDFADQLADNSSLSNKLIAALNKRKPFREFKFIIDNSGPYRQQWFDFRNAQHIEWVENQIERYNRRDHISE